MSGESMTAVQVLGLVIACLALIIALAHGHGK
jgi:hypothetical protein